MTIKSIASLICAATLGMGVGAYAADTQILKTRVSVVVAAQGTAKTEFESYVKRELRGLKDVDVVETSPDYTLSFVVLETQSKGGAATGYAISEVVTHRFRTSGI